MKFQPGQQVLVLDTTPKVAGSAIVEVYHPETSHYSVLFQYPGDPDPQSILLPEIRVIPSLSV